MNRRGFIGRSLTGGVLLCAGADLSAQTQMRERGLARHNEKAWFEDHRRLGLFIVGRRELAPFQDRQPHAREIIRRHDRPA